MKIYVFFPKMYTMYICVIFRYSTLEKNTIIFSKFSTKKLDILISRIFLNHQDKVFLRSTVWTWLQVEWIVGAITKMIVKCKWPNVLDTIHRNVSYFRNNFYALTITHFYHGYYCTRTSPEHPSISTIHHRNLW